MTNCLGTVPERTGAVGAELHGSWWKESATETGCGTALSGSEATIRRLVQEWTEMGQIMEEAAILLPAKPNNANEKRSGIRMQNMIAESRLLLLEVHIQTRTNARVQTLSEEGRSHVSRSPATGLETVRTTNDDESNNANAAPDTR